MSRVRNAIVLAALLLGTRVSAQATTQSGAPGESLTDLLLKQAQTALDAFDRPNAEKFAKQVLEQMTTPTAAQKQRARVILANVYYPEEAPTERKRAQTLAVLKEAVRENFDLVLDRQLSWAGIDSIFAEAKATTFGLAASAVPQQEVVGPDGRGEFKARASRPAVFTLAIRSLNGAMSREITDSTGGTEASLKFPTMVNDRPVFTTGEYEMVVTATDRVSGDKISSRYTATVNAPALAFVQQPSAIDSTRLSAERTKKYGWKGIIVGGLVAGSIYSFSTALHADTSFKTSVGPDSKGAGVAALAGLTLIAASYMDKGRQIPAAIGANQRLRDDLATGIRNAQTENASRIANHRTTITITSGAR